MALGEEMGDPELAAERLNILHRISSSRTGGQTIILTEGSLNDEVPSPDGMQNQGITLKTGETHAPDDLIRQFGEAGFEGVPQVISRGQWSRRGGILDVFPLQSSHPVRLEFFDDEIESIREFDVDSQISFRKAEHVNLILTEAEGAETLRDWIRRINEEKTRVVPGCASCESRCGNTDNYDMNRLWNSDEDTRSLKSLLLFGIRGIGGIRLSCHGAGPRKRGGQRLFL